MKERNKKAIKTTNQPQNKQNRISKNNSELSL